MQASTGTLGSFELDHAFHTVRFRRVLEARAHEVFEAWTQPEAITAWWDPAGQPLERCEVDLRPGGTFTFINRGHTGQAFTGTYSEIAPPDRLVIEALGAIGRVFLKELGETTEMRVEIACRSAEHLEQFAKLGVAQGTAMTLDNLVAFARRMPAVAVL